MGVSGSGKTTVGQALAGHLDCPFYDGDHFHPPANLAKMSSGIPLDDSDRESWLASLAALILQHSEKGEPAVLACSALKKRYRDRLRMAPGILFIYLRGSFDLIWRRMQARQDHYMKAEMLCSQFEALEPPDADEALQVSINQNVDDILFQILRSI